MDLPVSIKTGSLIKSTPKINVFYPIVTNLPNPSVEWKINLSIVDSLNKMLLELGYNEPYLVEMIGYYELKTNERGLLSLALIVYSFTGGAHGLTLIHSLTFDVSTGKRYELSELFKPNSQYIARLSEIIGNKTKEWDIALLDPPFTQIRSDQDFYLVDHSLVIYFQLYDISPYVAGFPYFPIPILDIADIINDNGPLGRLLPFT